MKQCTKCGETKPLSEFRKRKTGPEGRQFQCKECNRLDYQHFRESYPDKVRANYAANREKHVSRGKVHKATDAGRLKRASEHQCAVDGCPNTAQHWHHMNYEPDPALAPLCSDCHTGIHHGTINHTAVSQITTLSGLTVTVDEVNINYLKFGCTTRKAVSRKGLTIMKYCKGCRTRKDYSHFAPHARLCADCQAKRTDERRQYLAAWRKVNGAAAQREWRKRNPGYDKEYYRRKKERDGR